MNTRRSDRDLLDSFASERCEGSFAELVARHYGLVFGVALRKCKRRDWAEDITQEVFILLARKGQNGLCIRSSLASWLYRATLNLTAHRVRKERRYEFRVEKLQKEQTAHSPFAPRDERLVDALEQALLSLNADERGIVLGHFCEGKTYVELGMELGKGADACRKQCTRALNKLTEWLASRGYNVPRSGIGVVIASALGFKAGDATAIAGTTSNALAVASGSSLRTASGLLLTNAAAILIGAAFPFLIAWPSVASRFASPRTPVIPTPGTVASSSSKVALPAENEGASLDLEWLARALQAGEQRETVPESTRLQVLMQELDETQIATLASIFEQHGYRRWDQLLMRWGALNPEAAVEFVRFEETVRGLTLEEIRFGRAMETIPTRLSNGYSRATRSVCWLSKTRSPR